MCHCPEEAQPHWGKRSLRAGSTNQSFVVVAVCFVFSLFSCITWANQASFCHFVLKQGVHFSGDPFIFFINIIEKYSPHIYELPQYLSLVTLSHPK